MKKRKFKKLTSREKRTAITTLVLGVGLIIFAIIVTVLLHEWGEYIS